MIRSRRAQVALAFVVVLSFISGLPLLHKAQAQRAEAPFDFYARGPYRENVPRPQSILGFDVGSFHTNFALMERVVTAIAQAAPDRVRMMDMGQTNEHRMMRLVAISAPENIARLEEIRAGIARLADPRGTTPQEAQRIVNESPVIVWLNTAIHGNESASFETTMQTIYQLAASNEPATLEVLRNTVVLINVSANPDGHERFVTWYNSFGTGNPDPLSSEHREPWSVYGRGNRYRFDLNRDNVVSSQIETRHVQRAYLMWNPQVFVDLHGQTSQYFFPPAALPVNPNLPPAMTERWLTTFGRPNAAQFDARQWDFYVRDIFDLFYPGYWDSWPALNGATGMTYETDGGGWKGLNWRRDDETIVTFRSAIAKHFVASMTTLETAATNRAARLGDYYEFRRTAIEEGRTERMRRFVILPGSDPMRAAELVDILVRAGIEVSVAREPFRSTRAHGYTGAQAAAARSFPAGAYVVDLAQPQKRLAKALLEPNTEQDEAFVREQLARFARNERRSPGTREGYAFYDITAWSLPLAFGVEAYWTEDAPPVTGTLLTQPPITGGARSAEQQFSLPAHAPAGRINGGRAAVAYIIPYNQNGAASLIYRLLRDDYRVAVATRTLHAGGRDWPRGTAVVRISRNPDTLHEAVARYAGETGVEVTAVQSGFSERGETGVGSETVVSLRRPRIIVVADEPVNQTSYGALWWTFDRYGVDFTPMTIDMLRRVELDRYNVIIMPDGSAGRYFSALGRGGIDTLRGWVERGGTLVCIKGAAVFAALKDVNLTSSRLVGSEEDTQRDQTDGAAEPAASPSPSPSPPAQTGAQGAGRRATQMEAVPQEDRTDKEEDRSPILPPIASPSARPGRVPEGVPGAILRATVDRTTPLTYGYDEPTLPVLVDSGFFFRPSRAGTNAVVFSGDANETLRVAGFVWPNNTERLLRGTSYVIHEPTGRGHVVLYAEDPNYRGIWRNTTRLFFNSFLFQPIF